MLGNRRLCHHQISAKQSQLKRKQLTGFYSLAVQPQLQPWHEVDGMAIMRVVRRRPGAGPGPGCGEGVYSTVLTSVVFRLLETILLLMAQVSTKQHDATGIPGPENDHSRRAL